MYFKPVVIKIGLDFESFDMSRLDEIERE